MLTLAVWYSIIVFWLFFLTRDIDIIVRDGLWATLLSDVYAKIHLLLVLIAVIVLLLLRVSNKFILTLTIPAIVNFLLSMFFFSIYNFGIINFVWITIFSIFFAIYVYSTLTFNELNNIFLTKKPEAIEFVKEESTRNFRLGIQMLLALAASTGVSMSIVFRDGESSWHDDAILFDAIGMATGLVLMSIGMCIFLLLPYYILRQKIYNYYLEDLP